MVPYRTATYSIPGAGDPNAPSPELPATWHVVTGLVIGLPALAMVLMG